MRKRSVAPLMSIVVVLVIATGIAVFYSWSAYGTTVQPHVDSDVDSSGDAEAGEPLSADTASSSTEVEAPPVELNTPEAEARSVDSYELKLKARLASGDFPESANYRVDIEPQGRRLSGVLPYEGAKLGAVPVGSTVRITVGQSDLRFEAYTKGEVRVETGMNSTTLWIEIPEAETFQTGVVVDLGARPADEQFKIDVTVSGMRVCSGYAKGGEVWVSPIIQQDITVVVGVSGAWVWKSDATPLSDGHRMRFVPFPQQFGTVTLRVVFPEGVPSRNVLLTNDTSAMMAWENLLELAPGTSVAGEYAISDAEGVIRLAGIPIGHQTFALIGKGFTTQRVECDVELDSEVDAGTYTMYERE